MRFVLALALLAGGCSKTSEPAPASPSARPADAQHAGITTPHGDHSPHHAGMVLMNGDLHYEVVFDKNGKHQVWFSDAIRADLPASVATNVVMIVSRNSGPAEQLSLAIDESGESWVASGQPVVGDDVMVKVTYSVKGAPFEVEIPFLIPVK
ncbi:MAG: hypothetical protein ACRD2A_09080 [Vicinamibacterales bacterium]